MCYGWSESIHEIHWLIDQREGFPFSFYYVILQDWITFFAISNYFCWIKKLLKYLQNVADTVIDYLFVISLVVVIVVGFWFIVTVNK